MLIKTNKPLNRETMQENNKQRKLEKVPVVTKVLHMRVGQSGWLTNDDVIIVEVANSNPIAYQRIINLRAGVHPLQLVDGGIFIKRIGPGITGEDFELDFTNVTCTFDIMEKSEFKLETSPCLVDHDEVDGNSVKMYWQMDDLYEALRKLFEKDNHNVSAKPVQDLLSVLIKRLHNEYAGYTLVKLFKKYFDATTVLKDTYDYLKKNEDDDEYGVDYEYAKAQIEIEEAAKIYVVSLLKEKIPLEYHTSNTQRQNTICEKVNSDQYLEEELGGMLVDLIKQK